MSDTTVERSFPASAHTSYDQNSEFWVRIIRGNHDRFRTDLTDKAVLDAVGPMRGLRVLDAGCGEGYLARKFASSGATVLGIDTSENLIEAARSFNEDGVQQPQFRVNDVSALDIPDGGFDLVVGNHVMNDLPDPTMAILEFSRVLRPAGRLVILMLHPCFYSDRESRAQAHQGPGNSYFTPRKISQRFNVDRIVSPAKVTSWHRPLEFYVQALRQANLWITDLREPHPTDEQLAQDPWWQENFRRPLFLLLTAQKHGAISANPAV